MMALPPLLGWKKAVPNSLSASTIARAAARKGEARTTRKAVIRIDQVKSGIRKSFMPGARMLMMVTRKLTPPSMELTPSTCSPRIQRSWPMLQLNCFSVSGT